MKYPTVTTLGLALIATVCALPAVAADLTVTMHRATQSGTSDSFGTITIANADGGAAFKLNLHGLPPGSHGFHVNENANCDPTMMNGVRIPAGAAGGHFDPENTDKHAGPNGDGHLGDLPVLDVEGNSTATQTLVAPRIKNIETLKGHSLIIQMGGDNYSDTPNLDGGGGGRLACGIVE